MSEEDGERAGPRHVSKRGEAGGSADEVLLGNAHLEEPIRVRLRELVSLGGVGQIPVQDNGSRVVGAEFDELVPPGVAHRLHAEAPFCGVNGFRCWRRLGWPRSCSSSSSISCGSSSCRARSKSSADGTMLCQVCTPSAKDRPLPLTVCAMMTVGREATSPARANR